MRRKMLAALTLVLLLSPFLACSMQSESRKFIVEAIEGNYATVAIGMLAEERGASEAMRNYADRLAKDRAKANRQAVTVARSLNVPVPFSLDQKQRETYDSLTKLRGLEFDRRFACRIAEEYRAEIKRYEAAARQDDVVGRYARDHLPELRLHLMLAVGLDSSGAQACSQRTSSRRVAINRSKTSVCRNAARLSRSERCRTGAH